MCIAAPAEPYFTDDWFVNDDDQVIATGIGAAGVAVVVMTMSLIFACVCCCGRRQRLAALQLHRQGRTSPLMPYVTRSLCRSRSLVCSTVSGAFADCASLTDTESCHCTLPCTVRALSLYSSVPLPVAWWTEAPVGHPVSAWYVGTLVRALTDACCVEMWSTLLCTANTVLRVLSVNVDNVCPVA